MEKFSQDFRSNKYDSLFVEKSKSAITKTDSLKTKPKTENYTIDFNNILDRVELVSPNFGTQGRSYVLRKEDKTIVIYSSNHSENENHLWMTTFEPFEKPKTEKIEGAKSTSSFIVQSSDKYYALIGGNIHTLNIDGKKQKK